MTVHGRPSNGRAHLLSAFLKFAALAPDVILSANVVGIAQAPAKERREVRARVEA
jgi:hypothetical protein